MKEGLENGPKKQSNASKSAQIEFRTQSPLAGRTASNEFNPIPSTPRASSRSSEVLDQTGMKVDLVARACADNTLRL